MTDQNLPQRTFKQLTYDDRLKLDKLRRDGFCVPDLAEMIGVSVATIYRELARGAVYTDDGREYDPRMAQLNREETARATKAGIRRYHLIRNVRGVRA